MKGVQPNPAFFLLLAVLSLALALLVRFKARPGSVRNYFALFAVSVGLARERVSPLLEHRP